MEPRKLIETLAVAERLKDATRHCYTSGGRRESVAEHSWRMTLMAYFVSDEFPEAAILKLPFQILQAAVGAVFGMLLCWKFGIHKLYTNKLMIR